MKAELDPYSSVLGSRCYGSRITASSFDTQMSAARHSCLPTVKSFGCLFLLEVLAVWNWGWWLHKLLDEVSALSVLREEGMRGAWSLPACGPCCCYLVCPGYQAVCPGFPRGQ